MLAIVMMEKGDTVVCFNVGSAEPQTPEPLRKLETRLVFPTDWSPKLNYNWRDSRQTEH